MKEKLHVDVDDELKELTNHRPKETISDFIWSLDNPNHSRVMIDLYRML